MKQPSLLTASLIGMSPSAHAEIRFITESGAFVHTVEEACWDTGEGTQSQCAMAIYELVEGRVLNVWDFPANGRP